jgi:putative pyruvate formate lyase activating enzyme
MNEIFKIGNEAVVMDPSIEALSFLKNADPSFRIQSVRPTGGFVPRWQSAKDSGLLEGRSHEALAMLYACELCAWKCKANRFREKGKCGLGDRTFYHSPFIHIAEEPVINPALVINFTGCSMNCVYCVRQVQTKKEIHSETAEAFWRGIDVATSSYPNVCSLEFAGGDPNPYTPWILTCLKYSPDSLFLPIIWNSNLYVSEKGLKLLDGIVDVYLPDLAFGNDVCAKRLSGVDGYMTAAAKGIESMISQKARVIVRILVLPGHVDCCHKKTIDFLANYKDSIWISILDQYVPVHMASKYPEIYRRPKKEEIQAIEEYATRKGLKNVLDANDFWTR